MGTRDGDGNENCRWYGDWRMEMKMANYIEIGMVIKIKMADGIEMKIEMKMKMANCIEIGDGNENYKANGVGIGNEDKNKTANCIEMEMIMKMADGMEFRECRWQMKMADGIDLGDENGHDLKLSVKF